MKSYTVLAVLCLLFTTALGFLYNPHYGNYDPCYGIEKKIVPYSYYKKNYYHHGYGYGYHYYKRKCGKVKHDKYHYNAKCSKDELIDLFKYEQCTPYPCELHDIWGKSQCHGMVKLSLNHDHYPASQCRVEGGSCRSYAHGYGHGYGFGLFSRPYPKKYHHPDCQCKTVVCERKIRACYSHGGKYYEDHVLTHIPCGCKCYKNY